MPVSVVVGGQYGSEGKGKVAACFAKEMKAAAVIRCGGANSGHTVYDDKRNKYVFRQLPTSCLQPTILNILVAGSYIDVDVLLKEIDLARIEESNLCIDPFAVIITNEHKKEECRVGGLLDSIGSTGSGTGAAVKQRISRSDRVIFAKDIPELKQYIAPSKDVTADLLLENKRIIVEGTQGFGLSLLHSDEYPYVTSRDTTAAAFISESGISPLDVDDIVLVIRSFPIRVAGSSGHLPKETDWKTISIESKSGLDFKEFTSVTNQLRRVGRFDAIVVRRAILANRPTRIVLNHLDYISPDSKEEFVNYIQSEIGMKIDFVGESEFDVFKNPYLLDRRLYVAKT